IRPIIELLTVIQVITVLSWVFNYVYILTAGGPGYASSVMELYIWRSFSNGSNGAAASVAVMLLGMAGGPVGGPPFVRGPGAGGTGARLTARAVHRFLGVVSRPVFPIRICLSVLYPLWFIVSTALKSNAAYQPDPTGFPSHPTLDSLRTIVVDQPLPRWMWNSL